jgi:hypothetical protein
MPKKKFNILIADANITANPLPAIGEEVNAIRDVLDTLLNDCIHDSRSNLSFSSLIQKFNHDVEMLHWSGHSSRWGIQFDNENGEETSVADFVEFLRTYSNLKILFLNSCSSKHIGEELIKTGNIEVVIETTSPVYDNDAFLFSKLFYEELAKGHSIKNAFTNTQKAFKDADKALRPRIRGGKPSKESLEDTSIWHLSYKKERQFIETWRLTPESIVERVKANQSGTNVLCCYPEKEENCQYFDFVENVLNEKEDLIVLDKNGLKLSDIKDLIPLCDFVLFFLDGTFNTYWKEKLQGYKKLFLDRKIVLINCCGNAVAGEQKMISEFNANAVQCVPKFKQTSLASFGLGKEAIVYIKDELLRVFQEKPTSEKQRAISSNQMILNVLNQTLPNINFIQQIAHFETKASQLYEKIHQNTLANFQFSKFNLLLIEGTNQCAHEILVKKLLVISKVKFVKLTPHSLAFHDNLEGEKTTNIWSSKEIWYQLKLDILKNKTMAAISTNSFIVDYLKVELTKRDLIFIFDDFDSKNTKCLIDFWKEFQDLTKDVAVNYQFFLFILNRNFEHSDWSAIKFPQVEGYFANAFAPILPIQKEVFEDWHQKHQGYFKGVDLYNRMRQPPQLAQVLEKKYIGNVVTHICSELKCSQAINVLKF